MPNEVTWRVTPQTFSDIHAIIAKHGIGLGFSDEESMELYGRVFGPSAASLELIEKYNLRPLVPLMVIVDYKLEKYEAPAYGD